MCLACLSVADFCSWLGLQNKAQEQWVVLYSILWQVPVPVNCKAAGSFHGEIVAAEGLGKFLDGVAEHGAGH